MRNRFLPALTSLLACAGTALAQAPATPAINSPYWPAPIVPHGDASAPASTTMPAPDPSGGGVLSAALGACTSPAGRPAGGTHDRAGAIWAGADYLLWWTKDGKLPPLVTASPAASGGVLGQPGTRVLFGGGRVDDEERSGGRFTAGFWLDDDQTLGLEGGYLFLGSRTFPFAAGGPGAPGTEAISRPFFNAALGREDAERVAFPGELGGTVAVTRTTRLQGAELNALTNLSGGCACRLDLLAGFRYLQLDEGLGVREDLTVNPAIPFLGGSHFVVADQFGTHDRFYGGQVGARAEVRRGDWFVNVVGKVALGETEELVERNGATQFTTPGAAPTVGRGGLLALPSNSGRFRRDRFAVVPEAGVNVGYQITPNLRASAGYTFLYWSEVARPGDQIDRRVDPRQLPLNTIGIGGAGLPLPAPLFRGTDFWAQGINLGVELRF